jgi:hypothetical protein
MNGDLPDNFQVVVATPVMRRSLLVWLEARGWELFRMPDMVPDDLPTYGVRAKAQPPRRPGTHAPVQRGTRPYKLGWTTNGVGWEHYGSYASPDAAVRGRDRIIEGREAKGVAHLDHGWWVVVRSGRIMATYTLGYGRSKGLPLPEFAKGRG